MPSATIQNAAMFPIRSAALAFVALLAAFAVDARAVTIAWSPVGNPGNANDGTGFGAVNYNYSIGKYDVTNNQYVEFLNTKDATGANTLGLWNSDMADATFGGINFNAGNASGNKYTLISDAQNHPVNFVTWYDTIRFANWLNNGQGSGDTETGAYTLLGGTPTPSNANGITRNAGAIVFLPSQNEWYKAAYNIPGTNSYFQFPTSSNTSPTASVPTGATNSANYNGVVNNLTDVGAYTGTTSPYGAFDMGGNVYQWNETLFGGSFRGLRGGWFGSLAGDLQSSGFHVGGPTNDGVPFGFRVAYIPEPSTGVLAVIACGLMWWWRKRFK